MKRTLIILLVTGLVFTVATLIVTNRQAARQAAHQAAWQRTRAEREAEFERTTIHGSGADAPAEAASATERLSSEKIVPPSARPTQAPSVKAGRQTNVGTQAVAKAAPAYQAPQATSLKAPLARQALSFVGIDSEAEEVWALAINDPEVPANERKDLIEDLNEDGFPDPKNLTADDLLLIQSRIDLIEVHAPNAMDEVNAAAFMEAYKDLVNMGARLTQQ